MNKIPIGKIGVIESGDYKDWQVKVERCDSKSENFLVLISQDFQDLSSEGYDDWVEDFEGLNQYFKESKWFISWG